MTDEGKTREQLLDELAESQELMARLRQEIADCRAAVPRLESALRDCDRRFRVLLYNLPEKIFHKDQDSVYIFCNRNYAADFGLAPEQMVGKTDLDLFPAEMAAKYRADDRRILTSGESEEIEENYVTPTGDERVIRTVKAPFRDASGQVTGILGIFSDITERRRTEEALRLSESRYRALTEVTRDIIYIVDRQGTLLYANRAAQKCLGGAPQDLVGKGQADLFPPETARSHVEKVARVVESGQRWEEDELFVFSGQQVWLRVHLLPLRDDTRAVTSVMGVCHNITERKHAEEELQKAHRELEQRVAERTVELTKANEALRQSEAKYRALVESCPDAVAMVDLQGRVVFASQRAIELHGFDDGNDLLGRQAVSFVVEGDQDRFVASLSRLATENVHQNVEYRLLHKDGTPFDAEVSSSVIRNDAGYAAAYMAVYRDVTERKQTQARLRAKDAESLAAARIQARLLPQESPQVSGFDFAGRCYPAEAAAGDHFDFLPRPDGSLLIVLGDVSGHGIGPALVATDFCTRLRTLSEGELELAEMAAQVNAGLYRETDQFFVTAFLARLDLAVRRLTCLNAGHPPAIVLNAAGEVKASFASYAIPLAVEPYASYFPDDPVQLAAGDLILFYTDGLVEAGPRGELQFGIDRTLQIARENQQRSAREIVDALYHAACRFAEPERPADDITVVVVKVLPN